MKPIRKYVPRPCTMPKQQHPFAALSPRQRKKAQKARQRAAAQLRRDVMTESINQSV